MNHNSRHVVTIGVALLALTAGGFPQIANAETGNPWDDPKQRLKAGVFVWKSGYLSETLKALCDDVRPKHEGRLTDAELKIITTCAVWVNAEAVTDTSLKDITSGRIGPENAKSRLSPDALSRAVAEGVDNLMGTATVRAQAQTGAIAQPVQRAIGEVKPHEQVSPLSLLRDLMAQEGVTAAQLTGHWCWTAPASTAREKDGPPSATFILSIDSRDGKVTGTHCAIAQWGDRIDCAEKAETTITGKISGKQADIQFKSDYSGHLGNARLIPTAKGLQWIPLGESDSYLPNVPTDLLKCSD